jgi:alkylation response protein AidB-like acyl-CoA dehydrogenase
MPTPAPDAHPIVAAVRRFVDKEVVPSASALEHADAYPHELVARMRELGLFGALVPTSYGGLGLDVLTYARVIEEICRGFMSLAGVINSHTMAALIVLENGTDEQKRRLLPRFSRGEARGGLCLTEPHAGSDVQAIRTVARRNGERYLISGSKMFVTNGREGNTFALLALTDPGASPRHAGMSCFIVEKGEAGLQVVKSIAKLGYKGVDTAELLFDQFPCPATNLVGGIEGRGFKHVLSGLETGRINIAARAVGVAQAALEEAARTAGGMPEAPAALAAIALRVDGARLLTYWAAGMKDRGERCDLEAGMAKLYASESAQEAATDALRVLGGAGQGTAGVAERLYRDTPLMVIGEGTNEIQRTIIAKNLLQRHGERLGGLRSLESEPEERRLMALAVRQLVEREIAPAAVEDDRAKRFPAASLDKLGELGLFGATIPQEAGGLGLDSAAYVLIAEEIGRGSATVAAVLSSHLDAAEAILRLGSIEQQGRLLPGLASGKLRAGMLRRLRGPGAREVDATNHGDGFTITGSGLIASPGRHADLFVVLASVDEHTGAFLLEAGQPGFVLTEPFQTLGRRGADLWHAELKGCIARGTHALGGTLAPEPGAIAAIHNSSRVREAAAAVGLAQAAFETALRYSQQRSAFGVPICQHQAIQLKLADMATAIAVARLLTQRAAAAGGAGDTAASHAGMAYLHAAETARMVTLEAMRIHGGYGYTAEFPVERYYRDAAMLLAAETGDEDMRRAIARHAVADSQLNAGAP